MYKNLLMSIYEFLWKNKSIHGTLCLQREKWGNLMTKLISNIFEIPDIIYHGTDISSVPSIEREINLHHNPRRRPDFSTGFYTTANYKQAKDWAEFKGAFSDNSICGSVVSFQVDREKLNTLNSLFFLEVDEHWARFILANRSKKFPNEETLHNRDAKFDLVYGPLADGNKISNLIRNYEKGYYKSIESFIEDVKCVKYPFPKDHQISFHTEIAKSCLTMRGVDIIDTANDGSRIVN